MNNRETRKKIADAGQVKLYSRLSIAVFGQEPAMRVNVQRTFLSFSVYLIWMIIEAVCASRGLVSWPAVGLMYSLNVLGNVAFYTQIRSGWSARLNDQSMVLAQSIYGSGALMIVYVLIPETRAAALQTLCLTVVFGMFRLQPRDTIIACVSMLAMLLTTVILMVWLQAPGFDVKQELINVSVACIVLPALTSIARHFALLREKLRVQRAEIRSALGRVQELATRDALTNLSNRAHMQEILNQEFARHQRLGATFSLALLDIDYFKSINDQHGHPIGDEVLVGFATVAEAIRRQSDVIARWGGEEFLILMPETPGDGGLLAIERIREAVAKACLSTSINDLTVTVSAGLTQWRSNESLERTMERADRALYAAKNNGRNNSVLLS